MHQSYISFALGHQLIFGQRIDFSGQAVILNYSTSI